MTNERTSSACIKVRSIAILGLVWFILQIGGLFSPGLLDDVDSIYIEIAREMLHRHDYVTPYIDGIRFFDKPPLLYWLAAGSMHLFGEHDWAARLPLALAVLALFLTVYALGLRLFRRSSPASSPDRAALYSALALATAIGPYLYTRFFIPDILIALWMTLSVHFFLIALDRTGPRIHLHPHPSNLLPCLAFAATLALNLLTKGLIGLVFPLAFVFLYLLLTRQLSLLPRLHPIASTALFAVIALPWHILIAIRNPPITLPSGLGLPPYAGWTWFYLYNEHFARFLGKRIPHDYGQTPIWLFWLYAVIWIMPWATFLPATLVNLRRQLSHHLPVTVHERESALTLTLWTLLVLGFFTISSRQEYYSIPALPALALMTGGLLARAERTPSTAPLDQTSNRLALLWHRWFLLPLASAAAIICAFYVVAAPSPVRGATLSSLLASNPTFYNLSLGHLFDLTGPAMSLFRLPLAITAAGMTATGLISYLLRRSSRTYAANLTLAAGMVVVLLAAHQGLVRFNPILGSQDLADAILKAQQTVPRPNDIILIDGELTTASTLLFYTRQPVHLVNGRINGPWFGSFWPDAPPIFESEQTLQTLWHGPHRLFLLTYDTNIRAAELAAFGPVRVLASSGGKSILTNH